MTKEHKGTTSQDNLNQSVEDFGMTSDEIIRLCEQCYSDKSDDESLNDQHPVESKSSFQVNSLGFTEDDYVQISRISKWLASVVNQHNLLDQQRGRGLNASGSYSNLLDQQRGRGINTSGTYSNPIIIDDECDQAESSLVEDSMGSNVGENMLVNTGADTGFDAGLNTSNNTSSSISANGNALYQVRANLQNLCTKFGINTYIPPIPNGYEGHIPHINILGMYHPPLHPGGQNNMGMLSTTPPTVNVPDMGMPFTTPPNVNVSDMGMWLTTSPNVNVSGIYQPIFHFYNSVNMTIPVPPIHVPVYAPPPSHERTKRPHMTMETSHSKRLKTSQHSNGFYLS